MYAFGRFNLKRQINGAFMLYRFESLGIESSTIGAMQHSTKQAIGTHKV